MSIVVRFSPTNVDREKYNESLRRLESAGLWPNPAGLELHVAFGDEGNMRVSEIWASQEQFEAYGRIRVDGRRAGVAELRGEYDPSTLLTVAGLATKQSDPAREREAKPAEVELSRV